jgi:hypothetical protein
VHSAGDRVLISGATAPRELELSSSDRFWLSRGELVVDEQTLRVTWLDGEEAERARAEHFPSPPSLAKRGLPGLITAMITIDGLAATVLIVWWLAAGDPPRALVGVAVVASVLAIPFTWMEKRQKPDDGLE